MSESKQTSGTQSRTDSMGQRERIDSILTIGGILDEQSLRMVVGGAAAETQAGCWDLALAKGA